MANNMDHDRRLAKPAIVVAIEEFASAALGGGDACLEGLLTGKKPGQAPFFCG
ncbi:hypothetical protein ACFVXE_19540 [Streptomyces sp. NPDC058231]|uniref:hypothetical protein n=1 Tax=Streptomyces sp. NPDC058231 TaxID=3346392 RepID=UPI0036EFCF3D